MDNVFEEFKDLIERGLANQMPHDAKLIILGQILYAVTRDELTNQQAWQLEDLLGGREQWQNSLTYAVFGSDPEAQELQTVG